MAKLNFISDLRDLVVQELCSLGYPPKPNDDVDKVILRYLNLVRRLPPVVSWSVKKSKELTKKNLTINIQKGLNLFIKKSETGENLKPYLSTNIDNPDYTDLMFYDWGVFHFHLGIKLKCDGLINRTDELLFAVTDPCATTMYLIDIHPHKGGFTNQQLLKILEENWPEILKPYILDDVIKVSNAFSDDDIKKLRKNQINPIIQTPGGKILIPMGGGISLAGTSFRDAGDLIWAQKITKLIETQIFQNRGEIENYFKKRYKKIWDDLEFKMVSFGSLVRVKEVTTGEIVFEYQQVL